MTDNATTFASEEFAEFTRRNEIRHVRSPPYHPASNGLAERGVQTFKGGFKRFKSGTLGTRLSRFLLWYRITPHSSGSSPAEMMWGRTLRSKLDLVRPNSDVRVPETQEGLSSQDTPSPRRQFDVNDTVFAKNYAAGPKWLPGVVVGLQGSVMYRIRLRDNREIVRHVD